MTLAANTQKIQNSEVNTFTFAGIDREGDITQGSQESESIDMAETVEIVERLARVETLLDTLDGRAQKQAELMTQMQLDLGQVGRFDMKMLMTLVAAIFAVLTPLLSAGLYIVNSSSKNALAPIVQSSELARVRIAQFEKRQDSHLHKPFHEGTPVETQRTLVIFEKRLMREIQLREQVLRRDFSLTQKNKK